MNESRDHLKINGLEKVVMDRIKIPQCYRMFWGQSHLMGYEELLSKKVKAEGQSGQALRDSLKAVERLEEELDAGICLQSEYFCLLLKRSSK